jgi:phosphatidylglycerophosphatase A
VTGRDRVTVAIATALGVGFAPLAPGTVASGITALVLWVVPFSRPGLWTVLVVVLAAGTWAAHHAERVLGGKDPGAIVVDEVAGMILSVVVFPLTPAVLVAGFLLFRVFDVVKPPPAGASQRLPGGVGVMIDDVIAGLYALAVLAVGRLLVAA